MSLAGVAATARGDSGGADAPRICGHGCAHLDGRRLHNGRLPGSSRQRLRHDRRRRRFGHGASGRRSGGALGEDRRCAARGVGSKSRCRYARRRFNRFPTESRFSVPSSRHRNNCRSTAIRSANCTARGLVRFFRTSRTFDGRRAWGGRNRRKGENLRPRRRTRGQHHPDSMADQGNDGQDREDHQQHEQRRRHRCEFRESAARPTVGVGFAGLGRLF